ncbi:MAG: hypothetical protein NT154_16900 [Verrucomicrobia bacterium]|nr:hypothetical protein [Verrucomicrobiota bacterium]
MPRKDIDAEKAMEQLGERVRSGWAKLYPVMPNERAAVHEIVRQQWELEHGPANKADQDKSLAVAGAKQLSEEQRKAAEQQKNQSSQQGRDQDLGHSH